MLPPDAEGLHSRDGGWDLPEALDGGRTAHGVEWDVANRKALLLSLAAVLLLVVLAAAVARDRPPTLFPYPGRFVAVGSTSEGVLLDRWTGRLFGLTSTGYYQLPAFRTGAER